MDDKRQGEIAILMVRHVMRERGFALSESFARELGNIAKAIEVPVEELREFVKPLMQELLDECFSGKKK